MCSVLGLEHLVTDDRFIDAGSRSTNSGALVALMEIAFATRPMSDWRAPLDAARIPWAPFQNLDELVTDPQVIANGYIGNLELETGESFPLPAGAVQFDEHPASLHPAPDLGEHTDEVLLALGYEWEQIIALKLSGAVL
jgi:crotonobetainyl-CoA:carnitine CoA-transferase CaiB-like acyl-CoA transferase